jgi:hypothetical protein
VGLLLSDHNRSLVRLAEDIARHDQLLSKAVHASRAGANEESKRAAQRSLDSIVLSIVPPKPSFVMVTNRKAEVLAGVQVPAALEVESARDIRTKGLVKHALSDLWFIDGKLYRIAAAPLTPVRGPGGSSSPGVVVIARRIDGSIAKRLGQSVGMPIAVYANETLVGDFRSPGLNDEVKKVATSLSSVSTDSDDCLRSPTSVTSEGEEYWLLVSRLGGARSYLALFLPH